MASRSLAARMLTRFEDSRLVKEVVVMEPWLMFARLSQADLRTVVRAQQLSTFRWVLASCLEHVLPYHGPIGRAGFRCQCVSEPVVYMTLQSYGFYMFTFYAGDIDDEE